MLRKIKSPLSSYQASCCMLKSPSVSQMWRFFRLRTSPDRSVSIPTPTAMDPLNTFHPAGTLQAWLSSPPFLPLSSFPHRLCEASLAPEYSLSLVAASLCASLLSLANLNPHRKLKLFTNECMTSCSHSVKFQLKSMVLCFHEPILGSLPPGAVSSVAGIRGALASSKQNCKGEAILGE